MVTNNELQRLGLIGWRTGLANLLRKENGDWWSSRRWLLRSVLWAVGINGITAIMMVIMPQYEEQDPIHWGVLGAF